MANIIIEEVDIYERTQPNGTKEYFCVLDRGFCRGFHGIPDNYQSKAEKISKSIARREISGLEAQQKLHNLFILHF